MRKQIIISLSILLFLLIGTLTVVVYGKGYRFNFNNGKPELAGTGLLVTTSDPDGAQVYINGHLTTATDNTINLVPGEYTIRIFKDGYFPWEKKIKIQEQVVSKAEALLFSTAPKLESITLSGVQNATLDPSQTRLAYTVASQSAKKNGLYVLDMTTKPILTLQSASYQIADETSDVFSKTQVAWSPDGQELLARIPTNNALTTYLLKANKLNETPQDVTATVMSVENSWQVEKNQKDKARIEALKPKLKNLIQDNFSILFWSPDETKILYTASQSATIPYIITPRLIGTNSTPEERSIKKDSAYVYDIKEDKNYKIEIANLKLPSNEQPIHMPLNWFPDSKHFVYVHDKKIEILEYDGSNKTTIYAGPFLDNYVFPWPNGSKLVILTNLGNPDITPNLYTISLN